MLTKHLDNEEINQLPSVLEEPAMASVLNILFVVVILRFSFICFFLVCFFFLVGWFVVVFLNLAVYL